MHQDPTTTRLPYITTTGMLHLGLSTTAAHVDGATLGSTVELPRCMDNACKCRSGTAMHSRCTSLRQLWGLEAREAGAHRCQETGV